MRGERVKGKQVRRELGEDLPLPVPRGCGSRATGVRCNDVRGERVQGKQVGREQGEDLPLPVPGGVVVK